MRGKTPKANELGRLKMFLYGNSGAGKTTAAIQMPKPYVIDAERGSVHYNSIIADRGGAVYHTNSIDDAIEEVRSVHHQYCWYDTQHHHARQWYCCNVLSLSLIHISEPTRPY